MKKFISKINNKNFIKIHLTGYNKTLLSCIYLISNITYFTRKWNRLYVILYKVNEKHSRKTNIVKNLTNS